MKNEAIKRKSRLLQIYQGPEQNQSYRGVNELFVTKRLNISSIQVFKTLSGAVSGSAGINHGGRAETMANVVIVG